MHVTKEITEDNVLSFTELELACTLGLDFEGRVYLAGGAFKTLIHGRPPRDLDLWAPTPEDRNLLINRLISRGAVNPARHAYSDVLRLNDREIEVPDLVNLPSLEGTLAQFDIAFSAIGVEFSRGKLRAVIDPLAKVSAQQRVVRLLTPLANWKHALGTLARARRYAEELQWRLPPEEEAIVWDMFHSQTIEEQLRMIERYQRTSLPGWGVFEDARLRLQSFESCG